MEKQIFIVSIPYRKQRELHLGQKVMCVSYHESIQLSKTPSLNPLRYVEMFSPSKCGIIVGDAGIRSYYMATLTKGKEQFLFVKFKEYTVAKAIPVSCIEDAKEFAEDTERFLKDCESRKGEPGFDAASFIGLRNQIDKTK